MDPLGLSEGPNLYVYGLSNPLRYLDPRGLATLTCQRPLRKLPDEGRRSGPEWPVNPFFHEYFCITTPEGDVECHGQTTPWRFPWGPGAPTENDTLDPEKCDEIAPDDWCFENCLRERAAQPRPTYGLFGPGTNCQEWTGDAVLGCRQRCNIFPPEKVPYCQQVPDDPRCIFKY